MCSSNGVPGMHHLDLNAIPQDSLMAVSANRHEELELQVWSEGETEVSMAVEAPSGWKRRSVE
jgi:hypothetical protein